MAITDRIDLTGSLCVEEGCTKLKFSDVTGFLVTLCNDEYNALGYGLSGGIALDDVTEAVLNVYFPNMTTPITFTFTIASHVITACTLTDQNGVVTTITTDLDSTVFPLYNFDITKDYGVTIPTLSDGIIKWDYTISGLHSGETFYYTTSDESLSDCKLNCCIENKYLNMDVNCGCFEDKTKDIIKSEIFLWGARYSVDSGQNSKAQGFLGKGTEICQSNCKDC